MRDDLSHNSNQFDPKKNTRRQTGIRYASAPVKRLRFMPPTPFVYAPNHLHEMHQFGPICPQRFPVDFSRPQLELMEQVLLRDELGKNLTEFRRQFFDDLQGKLMKKLLPKGVFRHNVNLVRELNQFEQSEDCLNLNVFTPEEGEFTL